MKINRSFCLTIEAIKTVKEAAKQAGLSMSQYVENLILEPKK